MTYPDVTSVIPHRAPFLFVDRVVEIAPNRIVAVRTFRLEEPYFQGHFPDHPVVPGVLMLEGLAQTMAYYTLNETKKKRVFLIGIDRARFRSMVEPGKEIRYEVDIGEERLGTLSGKGRVTAEGGKQRVCDAELMGYAGDGKLI